MNPFPVTSLVRDVQKLILQTFEISEGEALEHAALVVALAEDNGGSQFALNLDWLSLAGF
jgi:hypothetical protein